MTDLTTAQIIAELEKRGEVHSASEWNGRIYVNIVGKNRKFAGDNNAKVFWDRRLGWRIEGLKGCMSSEFGRNIRAFAADHYRAAFWRD